jgi:hypothetical protein
MSWAGISSNQCVSRNNLQDAVNTGVFILKNTIPAGTRQITKAEANNYVELDTAYAPYAAKAFNQLVVKSNLIPCATLPYSYTLYCDYSDDASVVGLSTSSAACSETYGITVYSNSSSIGVGTELYFDSCGTQQIYAYSYDSPYPFYYKMGSSYITFENWDATGYGYVIRSITDCGGSLATILIGTNNSLDIALNLSNITVNGVNVVNVAGIDPNQPGNGASVQTSQIGTYAITMTYTCSVPGQNISLVDSAFNYQCINTSTGFNSMTFFGVVINTSVDLLLTCSDGTCF